MALEEPQESDVVLTESGARVVLEERVAKWLDGLQLDWDGNDLGGGFTFEHPGLSSCG